MRLWQGELYLVVWSRRTLQRCLDPAPKRPSATSTTTHHFLPCLRQLPEQIFICHSTISHVEVHCTFSLKRKLYLSVMIVNKNICRSGRNHFQKQLQLSRYLSLLHFPGRGQIFIFAPGLYQALWLTKEEA
jgi:hypothetical protein